MDNTNFGVHITHCCVLHGCKYGDENCPVASGAIMQTYPCSNCNDQGIRTIQDIINVLKGRMKTCPNCGHVVE